MQQFKKSAPGTGTRSRTALSIVAATFLLGGGITEASAKSHRHHHRHHHVESSSNSSSSQQSSSQAQDFNQLANSLQSGNLSAAQSAFSTLQNDIQQIGGTGVPATAGSVNVSV